MRAADDVRARRGAGDRARHRRRALLRLLARPLLRLRRPPPGAHEHLRGVPRAPRRRRLRALDHHRRRGAARRARPAAGPRARCAARSARPSRCATCAGATRRPASTRSSSSCRPGATATSTSASRSSCSAREVAARVRRSAPTRPTRSAPSASRPRSRRRWRGASRRAWPTPTTRSRPIASGPPAPSARRDARAANGRPRRGARCRRCWPSRASGVPGLRAALATTAGWSAPRARTRGLKVLFGAMAQAYEPDKAAGFAGELQYDLRRSDGELVSWTVALGPERRERPSRHRERARADAQAGRSPTSCAWPAATSTPARRC